MLFCQINLTLIPKPQTMNTSSNQQYKGPKLAPTPVSDHQYTGVNLDSKKHGSLSSYVAFMPPSAPARDTHDRGDIQAAKSLTNLRNAPGPFTLGQTQKAPSFNMSGLNISTHARTNDSPFSSEAEIHPSSGVSLNQSDSTMPTTTLPQHANFSQLAEHQGIHDWNSSVFDDRWLLQPEEIWNLEPRRDSVTTPSPERVALSRNTTRTGDQMNSYARHQRMSNLNAHMQNAGCEAEEKKKEHCGRQVANASAETRPGENRETFAASGKLATGQQGNPTNQ